MNFRNIRLKGTTLDIALSVVAFGVTFGLFFPFSLRGIDPHHDGIMLKPALDVLSGQTLFRDTFSQYGPLTTFIHVVFLWALGPTLSAIKIATVVCYALSASALVTYWRVFLPRSLVVLSLAVWLFFAPFFDMDFTMLPWSSVPALFFQTLGAFFQVKAISKWSPKLYPALSGLSCACVFLCRQPVGGCLLLSLTCVFVWISLAKEKRNFGLDAIKFTFLGFLVPLVGFFFLPLAERSPARMVLSKCALAP